MHKLSSGLKVLVTATRALTLTAIATSAMAAPVSGEIDTLYFNGKVYTMDRSSPVADAIVIRGNRVLGVGKKEELLKITTGSVTEVDLGGRAILPGLQDLHVHPMGAGIEQQQCQIQQGANLDTLLDRVRECVATSEPGTWVRGGQWDASALGVTPTAGMLDQAAPDNPVFLIDTSGHSAWANSLALQRAGLTDSTPDPVGGIVERDAAGNPSGVFRESAIGLVSSSLPPFSAKQLESALARALDQMLSYGITDYTDAAVGYLAGARRELEAYKELADSGRIKQHARICVTWSPATGAREPDIDSIIASSGLYAGKNVTVDCVKIFLDGVPTDSHTAAMLEPYVDNVAGRSDKASRQGLLQLDQEVLNTAVARFDAMGLSVKFHAAGDAAVRAGLDAIAHARSQNGYSGALHSVGHCTFVDQADLPRGPAIGATFELSPYLWSPSPINDDITKAVGSPRIDRVWPFRELLDHGALVVVGSDWAVVPSVNPWIAIESLVTRQRAGGSEDSFGAPEAITLQEALELFTVNAARHKGRQFESGRLAPGMLADLIVVDRDPFSTPANELHQVRVMATMIDGDIVFERKNQSQPL
jgi:predicted amidohydrolase YtcJ